MRPTQRRRREREMLRSTTRGYAHGGGGASGNPPPPTGGVVIASLSPASVGVGSADLSLIITGSNLDLVHPGSHETRTVAVWFGSQANPVMLSTYQGRRLNVICIGSRLVNGSGADRAEILIISDGVKCRANSQPRGIRRLCFEPLL